jgi:hypothetical protein
MLKQAYFLLKKGKVKMRVYKKKATLSALVLYLDNLILVNVFSK